MNEQEQLERTKKEILESMGLVEVIFPIEKPIWDMVENFLSYCKKDKKLFMRRAVLGEIDQILGNSDQMTGYPLDLMESYFNGKVSKIREIFKDKELFEGID